MEKYVKMLKDKGLKVTPQRLEILRYLDKNMTHPTAEIIFTELKETNPSLSLSTVYSTLNLLTKYDIVQPLTITEGEVRYDMKGKMHHHFLCKRCGTILDIDVTCPHLETMLNGEHRVEEVHGYLKGICSTCLERTGMKSNSEYESDTEIVKSDSELHEPPSLECADE